MSSPQLINRALEQAGSGQLSQALASLRAHVQRKPNDLDAAQVLGMLLVQAGEFAQAHYQLARAVAAQPRAAGYRNNLANCLMQMGRDAEAAAHLDRAIELDPNYARAYLGLTICRTNLFDSNAAIAAAERGLAIKPHWPELISALLTAYGPRIDAGIEVGLATLAVHPAHASVWSQLLMLSNYSGLAREEISAMHSRFGAAFTPQIEVCKTMSDSKPRESGGTADKLRVGFISPDLRTHSVAYFTEPLFRCAPKDIALIVFSLAPTPNDPMTQHLRRFVHEWHEVAALDHAALDQKIRDQSIDVLVELSGHTGGNRIAALAAKPAPLMLSAIGYPNSTGLEAIDLRLCDAITDPEAHDQQSIERPMRISPCFLCYSPPTDAPQPALPNEGSVITFGSFNLVSKISEETSKIWAGVMNALPTARLLLKCKTLADPAVRIWLLERLNSAGISTERVELLPATPTLRSHLELYSRVHVALDTYPYNGTTTTCEALWMGVPVVTLLGDRHAARVGASLLSAIGRAEFIATSADDYVEICKRLAQTPLLLSQLRSELRQEMLDSPLLDAQTYATKFYGKVLEEWRASLGGLEHC
jgi:protein O-GlcNAc transferase